MVTGTSSSGFADSSCSIVVPSRYSEVVPDHSSGASEAVGSGRAMSPVNDDSVSHFTSLALHKSSILALSFLFWDNGVLGVLSMSAEVRRIDCSSENSREKH